MKNEEILQKTRTFVETCMSGNDPSHDFSHVHRVFDHAVRIADTMTGCDRFYLEMLVLLHDIDDRKLAAAGAHRVDDFLETLPLSPSYRQRISEGGTPDLLSRIYAETAAGRPRGGDRPGC